MHIAITGASSGIGRCLAQAFARPGARLTVVARRRAQLEALADSLDVPVCVLTADLSDLDAATAWVDEAERAHGPIDVLVNNAGVQVVDPVLDVAVADAERMFRLDTLAPVRLVHRVAPGMVERGGGCIVNVASVAAYTFTPGMAHYNAAKAALAAFSETLRAELAPSGVHVVTVYPGPIRTPMEAAARARFGSDEAPAVVQRIPTGQPEVLARLVVRAFDQRRPRVIYPAFYRLGWRMRHLAQWLTFRATPALPPKASADAGTGQVPPPGSRGASS